MANTNGKRNRTQQASYKPFRRRTGKMIMPSITMDSKGNAKRTDILIPVRKINNPAKNEKNTRYGAI
jgi:hypothetical protein